MTQSHQPEHTFKIGDLSRLFHIGADSIRYYERLGLLHLSATRRATTASTP